MYRCYTGTHIREAEQPRLAAGEGPALMRTAAWGLAQHTLDFLRHRGRIYGSRVIGLVGKGNNGGDTLWALSFLAARGVHIEAVAITAERDQLHPAARTAFRTAGGRFTTRIDHATDVVLDGVFGTGFSGTFDMPTYLADRNLHTPDTAGIIACDIPSGVHADTGNIPGASLQADVTVTFGGPTMPVGFTSSILASDRNWRRSKTPGGLPSRPMWLVTTVPHGGMHINILEGCSVS